MLQLRADDDEERGEEEAGGVRERFEAIVVDVVSAL